MRQIIGMTDWLETPQGQTLAGWEGAQLAAAVSDVFGFHALQLGMPAFDSLASNRMPHRWLAMEHAGDARAQLVSDFAALPFPEHSLDLVVMPHTLELNTDPHGVLREVARVLVPDGKLVLTGFNPVSLWGQAQQRARLYQRLGFGQSFLPEAAHPLGYWRVRDWLRLLNLELDVASSQFGCFRPALRSQRWLERFAWLDGLGQRAWPIFGSVYLLVAVKRVRGLTMLSALKPAKPRVAAAPVTWAGRQHRSGDNPSSMKEHL
jgi:SAM-dependent methyltransferase